jgi:biotin synthase
MLPAMSDDVRHDWTTGEVEALHALPLTELVFRAQTVHRRHHDPDVVQRCTLLSIKTGGCPEDCAYCPQSAHYDTGVEREGLLDERDVLEAARRARDAGSSRFCMGAAWREVKDGAAFDEVLGMVEGVARLGMEVCVTLGMLTAEQARRLKAAGLTAYNHNLDTSAEFYPEIITTRTYGERLETLQHVQEAGLSVCCGGIVGMGESVRDRCALLGVVACARLVCPKARVRLSAGRLSLSDEAQALCFLAGANSIFSGEKLLTAPNPGLDHDQALVDRLGLRFTPPPA